MYKRIISVLGFFWWSLFVFTTPITAQEPHSYGHEVPILPFQHWPRPQYITVPKDITVANYFTYMATTVEHVNAFSNFALTEHLLVWHNPWIIDTLAGTDYYRMMARDSFVYDQKKLVVLRKGQILNLPDSLTTLRLQKAMDHTWLDVNIPEYALRVYQDSMLRYRFPVRVGQNRSKYLVMGDRVTNLRTKTGSGSIVGHVKDPHYYNPATGKRYHVTRRDDERVTLLPQIPWLVTEVNGIRHGQLIHPTTNPNTLGKASSNGCIGTKEGDAWILYYHAPVGTRLQIRYDLQPTDAEGRTSPLKDIYGYFQ